jgi:hypothetical protein
MAVFDTPEPIRGSFDDIISLYIIITPIPNDINGLDFFGVGLHRTAKCFSEILEKYLLQIKYNAHVNKPESDLTIRPLKNPASRRMIYNGIYN